MAGDLDMDKLLRLEGIQTPAILPGPPTPCSGGVVLPPGEVRLVHSLGYALFYRHGWHSWSPCTWLPLDQPVATLEVSDPRPHADDPDLYQFPTHAGSGVGALRSEDDLVLLLGGLCPGTRVQATGRHLDGHWEGEAANDLAGPPEAGWFVAWGPQARVFRAYADCLQRALGFSSRRTGPVWCSWYGFYQDISEETLHEALDGLGELPFEVFQVDDGWQQELGDWRCNKRFPSGMPALAERIRAGGRHAGYPQWIQTESPPLDPTVGTPMDPREVTCRSANPDL